MDRLVNATLRQKIFLADASSSTSSAQWDVLITHLLGVDHCGHRYGPQHPEMQRKLLESDHLIQFIYQSMSEDTLLVVFGDHGMTSTGDHGGDSREETNSALVLLSKASQPFLCPSEEIPSISQIDLVPTLSFLLGVPIPYSSIGALAPNILPPNRRHLYTDALSANAAQVHTYFTALGLSSPTITSEYQLLSEAYQEYQLARSNMSHRARFHTLAHRYLLSVKNLATTTWTQFHVPMIYTGVLISGLACLSLFLYLLYSYQLLESPSPYTALSWLWPSLPVWSVLWTFVARTPTSSNILAIIISTLAGLLMFLLLLLFKVCTVSGEGGSGLTLSVCDVIGILLYSLSCAAVFSNSYLINEPYLLGSLILLLVFLHLLSSPPPSPFLMVSRKRIECSLVCLLIFALLLRTCSIFFRCREELPQCSEQYLLHKQLASLPDHWLVHKYVRYSIALLSLAIFVVAFRLWLLYRRVLFIPAPAPLTAKFIPSLLVVLLGVFWALQGLPLLSSTTLKLRPFLQNFPWAFQVSSLISLAVVYIRPLFSPSITFASSGSSPFSKSPSIFIALPSSSDPPPTPCPSTSLLLFTTLVIILLSSITPVGIAPAVAILIPYMIVCLVGIFRSAQPSSWCPALVWTLLSQYMFYGTGHQPIFSAIPWDSAFLSGGTDQAGLQGPTDYLRPALAVLGNLHVSQVIFSLAMPLMAYWSSGAQNCLARRQNAYVLCGKFLLLHALKVNVTHNQILNSLPSIIN